MIHLRDRVAHARARCDIPRGHIHIHCHAYGANGTGNGTGHTGTAVSSRSRDASRGGNGHLRRGRSGNNGGAVRVARWECLLARGSGCGGGGGGAGSGGRGRRSCGSNDRRRRLGLNIACSCGYGCGTSMGINSRVSMVSRLGYGSRTEISCRVFISNGSPSFVCRSFFRRIVLDTITTTMDPPSLPDIQSLTRDDRPCVPLRQWRIPRSGPSRSSNRTDTGPRRRSIDRDAAIDSMIAVATTILGPPSSPGVRRIRGHHRGCRAVVEGHGLKGEDGGGGSRDNGGSGRQRRLRGLG